MGKGSGWNLDKVKADATAILAKLLHETDPQGPASTITKAEANWLATWVQVLIQERYSVAIQADECRKLLGYDDGDLLDNVTRYKKYAESEIETLRAGGERVAAYALKLQEQLPLETVKKIGMEMQWASGLNDSSSPTAADGSGGAERKH